MARWRRLARAGSKLLACAVGGTTTHGETLRSEPRYLAIHPLYEKKPVVIDNSDLLYVRIGETMSFNPKFRRQSYSVEEWDGSVVSVSREVVLAGGLAPMDEKLPYRENGLNIDDLNSHGVAEDRYYSARKTRYTFSADFIFHETGTRTDRWGRVTPIDGYGKNTTQVMVDFDWDSGTLEIYKWEPTAEEIEIMGPLWDVYIIDDDATPPIRVELGEDVTAYVYEAVNDEDFPVGVDYRKPA